jgi:predicted nuclease of predicted toxin-antitoxin system
MRILANENFPREAVEALRAAGHDIAWVRTDRPGSSDKEVLACAQAEGRLLLTFDKDFGELAFRSGLSAASGVILFRVLAPSPAVLARLAVRVLDSRLDWPGHFCVIENDRIRMTPLPFQPESRSDPKSRSHGTES